MKPFAHTLALALGRTGKTDKKFAQDAGMPASALSSYKIARNFPPPARMSQILSQFRRRPRDYHALLTSYLLDCSPTGYRDDLARLLADVSFLDTAQIAEDSTTADQDQEFEAALARLAILATRKKHVRDLLDLLGKSPIRLRSET